MVRARHPRYDEHPPNNILVVGTSYFENYSLSSNNCDYYYKNTSYLCIENDLVGNVPLSIILHIRFRTVFSHDNDFPYSRMF